MATLESRMPHDMKVVSTYIEHALHLRNIFSQSESPALPLLADHLTEATAMFSRCEQQMRLAERIAALEKKSPLGQAAVKRAKQFQDKGLKTMKSAGALIDKLMQESAEAGDKKTAKAWTEFERDMRGFWKNALIETDMKQSDAIRLEKVMDECCRAGAGGAKGLANYIGEQFAELERLRKTPSRGMEQNYTAVAIAAVAAWLGVTTWFIYNLLARGAAWWEVALYILLTIILALLAIFG